MDEVVWVVGVVRVVRVAGVVGLVVVDGVVWVLRTKTSQEEQQQLYLLLDHAATRLVKNYN